MSVKDLLGVDDLLDLAESLHGHDRLGVNDSSAPRTCSASRTSVFGLAESIDDQVRLGVND